MSNDPVVPAGHVVRYGYTTFARTGFATNAGLYLPAIQEHVQTVVVGAAGHGQPMNCPVGYWQDDRFWITHGRHRFLAAVIAGFEHILVRWIEKADEAV